MNSRQDTTPHSLVTIAVSSRALFDFEEENAIFDRDGEAAYMEEQKKRLNKVAPTGIAYGMVKKLLAFNDYSEGERLVDVIVVSRNDPITGLRVFRAISEYDLDISRGCFTRGGMSSEYLSAFGTDLFLSAFDKDVRNALDNGIPAARVLGSGSGANNSDDATLRIAFDGDAVLFGDASERVYQSKGLSTFQEQEKDLAAHPLEPGPFKPFLEALVQLRQKLPADKIRTALITARGAPAHERPLRTFMQWNIDVDEAFFLGGRKKQQVLESFQPDFFFDDQERHLNNKQAGGHVVHGVTNEQ